MRGQDIAAQKRRDASEQAGRRDARGSRRERPGQPPDQVGRGGVGGAPDQTTR